MVAPIPDPLQAVLDDTSLMLSFGNPNVKRSVIGVVDGLLNPSADLLDLILQIPC